MLIKYYLEQGKKIQNDDFLLLFLFLFFCKICSIPIFCFLKNFAMSQSLTNFRTIVLLRELSLLKKSTDFPFSQSKLKKFLKSPFFNENQNIVALYEYIEKYQNRESKLTREHICKHLSISPKKESPLNKLLNKLTELIIQFLQHTDLQNNEYSFQHKRLQLTHFVEKFNIKTEHKKARDIFDNSKCKATNDYYYNYLTELEYAFYLSRNSIGKGYNYEETNEALDVFFILHKLKWLCQIINRQQIVPHFYKIQLKNHLLDFLNASRIRKQDNVMESGSLKKSNSQPVNYLTKYPIIEVWYYALLILEEKNKEKLLHYYQQLKEKIQGEGIDISTSEKRTIYTYLENTIQKDLFEGSDLYKELWEVYESQLKEKIQYVNGCFPARPFRNYITVCIRLQKLSKAQEFLDEHKAHINPIQKEDVENISSAIIDFEAKKYAKVSIDLEKITFNDIDFKIEQRRLILKSYYELGANYDFLFFSKVEAFRTFLSENNNAEKRLNITEATKHVNQEFITAIRNLYDVKISVVGGKRLEEIQNVVKTIQEKSHQELPEKKMADSKIEGTAK